MTKLITLAAAALALTAGAAMAENTFQIDRTGSTASSVVLKNVQADQPGTIEVYSYNESGNIGRFLGWTPIQAGSNGDVEVTLNQPSNARLQILMSNGNRAVATADSEALLTN